MWFRHFRVGPKGGNPSSLGQIAGDGRGGDVMPRLVQGTDFPLIYETDSLEDAHAVRGKARDIEHGDSYEVEHYLRPLEILENEESEVGVILITDLITNSL